MNLQEDNNQLRQQLLERAAPKVPTMHLTESQQLVLEEAAKAVSESDLTSLDEGLEGDAATGDAGVYAYALENPQSEAALEQ